MTAKKPDHPALTPLALFINEVRGGRVKGTPRQVAEQVIQMVFEGEVEKWEGGYERIFEGGGIHPGFPVPGQPTPNIKQTGSITEGTHHREVLAFYGAWIEGSPLPVNRELKRNPITGEDDPRFAPPAQPATPPKGFQPGSSPTSRMFRDAKGNPLKASAGTHNQVTITNLDGESTTFYGADISFDAATREKDLLQRLVDPARRARLQE